MRYALGGTERRYAATPSATLSATRSVVLTGGMLLRVGDSGGRARDPPRARAARAYGAARSVRCCAVCGTELAYAVLLSAYGARRRGVSLPRNAHPPTRIAL
eukprot:2690135-Rhodomonas_salina.1